MAGQGTPYADLILTTSGLVSYWPLKETSGTTATDLAGYANGTYSGVTLNQSGPLNLGASTLFAESGTSNVTIGTGKSSLVTAKWTWMAWVYPNAWQTTDGIMAVISNSGSTGTPTWNRYFRIRSAAGGGTQGRVEGGTLVGSTIYDANSSGNLSLSTWSRIAWRYDGAVMSVFLNKTKTSATHNVTADNSTREFALTGRWAAATNWRANMNVAHVACYNTNLSDATLDLMYDTAYSDPGHPAGQRLNSVNQSVTRAATR